MNAQDRQAPNDRRAGLRLVGDDRAELPPCVQHPSAGYRGRPSVRVLPPVREVSARRRIRALLGRFVANVVDALAELPEIDGL